MSTNTIPTESFLSLTTSMVMNLPFVAEQYSTLNEALAAGNVAAPNNGTYPNIKYLAIGRGGVDFALGTGNNALITRKRHGPFDAALFSMLPFQLVPVNADLSAQQRANYRLRIPVTYNGVEYIAYYLKVIDVSSAALQKRVITIQDNIKVSDIEYTSSSSRLSPTPINVDNTNINVASGSHIVARAVVPITLTADDLTALTNACTIIYGSADYASVSEAAFVSGWDKTVTVGTGQNALTYTDVQCAQVMAFQSTYITTFDTSEVVIPFSISNSAPIPGTV